MVAFGIDAVWFGIIMIARLEIGFTTPPVGLNLFVIQGMMPGASARDVRAKARHHPDRERPFVARTSYPRSPLKRALVTRTRR